MKKYIILTLWVIAIPLLVRAQKSSGLRIETGADLNLNVNTGVYAKNRYFMDTDNRTLYVKVGHYWRWKRWEMMPFVGYFNHTELLYGWYPDRFVDTLQGLAFGLSGEYCFHQGIKWQGYANMQINVDYVVFPSWGATFFIPLGSDKWQAFLKPSIGFRYREKEFPAGLTAGIQYRYRSKP